jgi:hypothetical protein
MKPLAFVLLVVLLHVGVASVAASRHLFRTDLSIPLLGCDPTR